MRYKYLLILLPLLALTAVAQSTGTYYTGFWVQDPGIRLYNICCAGSVQLPGNSIRIYAPGSDGIQSYISQSGLSNISLDSNYRIRATTNFTPANPKVILTKSGTYRMYFTISGVLKNGDPTERIYTATSPDSLRFFNTTLIAEQANSTFNNATGYVSNP